MSPESVFLLRGAGFLIGGVVFWIFYFDLKDRLQPEPRRLLAGAFLAGMFSAPLALAVFWFVEALGAPRSPGSTTSAIAVYCFLLIGPIEEGCKFLAGKLSFGRWREFDEPVDGIIYAAMLSIGFATLENILYFSWLSWPQQLARFFSSPLSHALFAAIWGYGMSQARFTARTPRERWLWQAGTLAASMLLHGFYDFALFAWNATYVSGLLALVVWVAMVTHIRRTLRAAEALRDAAAGAVGVAVGVPGVAAAPAVGKEPLVGADPVRGTTPAGGPDSAES